jgi:hypothetical protein
VLDTVTELGLTLPSCARAKVQKKYEKSIHLSTYPPIHLSTYPPIHLSIYLSIDLSIYLSNLSINQSIYLSIHPSIHLSNLSTYLPINLPIDLPIYLPVYLCTYFSTAQRPKLVRMWRAFNTLTSKFASRHNRMHFLDISTSKSVPKPRCFLTFWLRNVRRATTACTYLNNSTA